MALFSNQLYSYMNLNVLSHILLLICDVDFNIVIIYAEAL